MCSKTCISSNRGSALNALVTDRRGECRLQASLDDHVINYSVARMRLAMSMFAEIVLPFDMPYELHIPAPKLDVLTSKCRSITTTLLTSPTQRG
jgi:hypothetical protein